jgi:RimJ/RimL family protein N-acetyltransferase
MNDAILKTERLVLRRWRETDEAPMHAISTDPLVMATLGPLMSLEEVRALIGRLQLMQAEHGYCFWAMALQETGALIGLCGLKPGAADTPLEGRLEIGWRLGSSWWGRGYAREAATACLDWAWNQLDADSVWAITSKDNSRSWGLMERLGMSRQMDLDFDHPSLTPGDPLRRHITYRATRR